MLRRCLWITGSVLFACTSLFGQDSSSETTPSETTKPSVSDSPDDHGIYTSGFEVLEAERSFADLKVYPDQILFRVRRNWYAKIPDATVDGPQTRHDGYRFRDQQRRFGGESEDG